MTVKRMLAGVITEVPNANAVTSEDILDRRALIVYEGKFVSGLDGDVVVTRDDIVRLAAAHNARLERATQGRAIEAADCPPIQVDHSEKAVHTAGRLWGPVIAEDFPDGEMQGRMALWGTARIMGTENVAKAKDGRWVHLSVGADFQESRIIEVSITPFPAAANAKFLSSVGKGDTVEHETVHEKLVKECMSKWNIDETEAEKHLAGLSYGEVKRMSVDGVPEHRHAADGAVVPPPEDTKKDGEDDENDDDESTELSAARSAFTTRLSEARFTVRKQGVVARLSGLKSQAKMTPAELKKIDVEKMARLSGEAFDAVMQTYENREPVIIPGVVGSAKGLTTAQLAEQVKKTELKTIEDDARVRMGLGKPKGKTRLAGDPDNVPVVDAPAASDAPLNTEAAAQAFERVKTLIEAGSMDEARAEFLKAIAKGTDEVTVADQAAMLHLSAALDALEADHTKIVRLSRKKKPAKA